MNIDFGPALRKTVDFPSRPLPEEVLEAYPHRIFDVEYCVGFEEQKLDIWYPADGPGPYPALVFFHGGAFSSCTKRDASIETALRATERGYAVVCPEFRKSPQAHFPAMLYDAKAAIRFLRANCKKYRLDCDRIAAMGFSSGGWVASMLGVTAGNPAFEDRSMGNAEQSSEVKAVIDVSGPCGGFLELDRQLGVTGNHSAPDSPESRFMGVPVTEAPELVRLACPMSYIEGDIPPFLIIHGSADRVIPMGQSEALFEKIRLIHGDDRARLHICEGAGHVNEPWVKEQGLCAQILDFLDKNMIG